MSERPVAVITGASSGIGRALAGLAAADGYELILIGSRPAALQVAASDLTGRFGAAAEILAADLATPGGADTVVAALADRPVELLINNAGYNVRGPVATIDVAGLTAMIQIHIATVVRLTRCVLPGMIARRSGRVLNVGSVGLWPPSPNEATYCAAKAFVLGFHRRFGRRGGGFGRDCHRALPRGVRQAQRPRLGRRAPALADRLDLDRHPPRPLGAARHVAGAERAAGSVG